MPGEWGNGSRPETDLLRTVVRFGRALRENGIPATPDEIIAALRALEAVDLADRREVFWALRAVLAGRVEDYTMFAELFEACWSPESAGGPTVRPRSKSKEKRPNPSRPRGPSKQQIPALSLRNWMRPDVPDVEPVSVPTVGEQESLREKDFSTFSAEDLDEITRAANRLARRLSTRSSRRWRSVRRGVRVDPRRTLRRSFRTGGEMVELAFRARQRKKTRLVMLCDVSGSMDLYARFLIQFLYALQHCFSRVETFVFSTRLSRVTEQLRGDTYLSSLERLSGEVHDWSGGTRIGASLTEFQRDWSRLVDHRTIVGVLSDGWDTGEPEELGRALQEVRRRAGKLLWMNPLLGRPDYQPLTRGMQAALPHLDAFVPVHNLASLQALARHLEL